MSDSWLKIVRDLGKAVGEFQKAAEGIAESLDSPRMPVPSASEPAKPERVLPKPPWRIFLSSVVKDMAEERACVKQAAEALPDLAQAWTWEEGSYASPIKTPEQEYLPQVSACHIFLLIVKDDVTAPVRKEYETARQLNKPFLLFVKNCERTPAAQEVVDAIGKEMTYAVFTDSEEPDRLKDLDDKVRKAVAQLVIDKFDIDDGRRRALGEQIAALETQIEEREKKIGRLEKERIILAGTTIAGTAAAVIQAASQLSEPKPTPAETPEPTRIRVSAPKLPRIEKTDSLFTPQTKRGRDGKRMIRIPAGWFWMGSDDSGWDDEKPLHKVYLDAYYIDETPVTNAEYKRFVDATGHAVPYADWSKEYSWDRTWRTFPGGKDNHPVVFVTWDDASAYARWAGKRLPTEAEWEKAARGTDGRRYPWGNEQPDANRCNFNNNKNGTTPVGEYSPHGDSPYHVKDMAGNVWEWCADWYDANYYKNSPKENPEGSASGQFRVLRGGSWNLNAPNVRAAYRDYVNPADVHYLVGFRCVA